MTLQQVATSIANGYFAKSVGRPVVIVCDEAKLQLAQALRFSIIAQGGECPLVNMSKTPPECMNMLSSRSDIGLAVFASHRMWLNGLSRYFTFKGGRPALAVECQPVFFDFLMPLDSVLRVYGSDYEEDIAYLLDLSHQLPSSGCLRLMAPGGTDLTFIPREWLIEAGSEIHTSPIEQSINGKIVVDASVFFSRVSAPLELQIEQGMLTEIKCRLSDDHVFQQYVREMSITAEQSRLNWQLAEVGLGGNSVAVISGCIMEDEMVRDTCHFCFGDNSRYGGENATPWHGGTVVIRSPLIRPAK